MAAPRNYKVHYRIQIATHEQHALPERRAALGIPDNPLWSSSGHVMMKAYTAEDAVFQTSLELRIIHPDKWKDIVITLCKPYTPE